MVNPEMSKISPEAHRAQRTREHVTSHTHSVNGKIQTLRIFPYIVYPLYDKS